MINLNRREFIQASAASMLLNRVRVSASPAAPAKISETPQGVEVKGKNYTWQWFRADDRFRFSDGRGLLMTKGTLQPAVIVQPGADKHARKCTPGKPDAPVIKDGSVTINYAGVNGNGKLAVTWRFDDEALWLDPVVYETAASENVVSLHYFAQGTGDDARPTLDNYYLILPGISESPAVSPIVTSDLGLNLTSWLGRGSSPAPGLLQQWGLPAHFFCGFERNHGGSTQSALTKYLSDAFCCGLAELPTGDLFLETRSGLHSLIVSYRSDIWQNLQGPGSLHLGAKLYWAIGPNYYQAIRAYYRGLVQAGVVQKKTNSAKKNSVVTSPQYNTWGAEVAIGKADWALDEAALTSFYSGMKTSGMKARMFVVDAKWEGKYGKLEHDAQRLPHFEEFREQVQTDGLHFGLWAAFMRCQDPAEMGLNLSQMLHLADGSPLTIGSGDSKYYVVDFTRPEVEQVLRSRAKRFVERYKPDLVKFDFGYELPPLSVAAPQNMTLAGERLMMKGLEVVVGGMREANPDIVVMYYSLSPLFLEYFDLHSPDDLFMAAGDYDYEANRRFFFSSLLSELGMPTYGSGGYDWGTMPAIWFDSALIGTLGSLNSFAGDEEDRMPTPELIAKYNGLSQTLRNSNVFTIEPVDADYIGPVRGAHAASWARFENDELVAVALRTRRLDGRKASGKFRDVVETSAPVVIASKSKKGIATATSLAIVPYGEGEVTVHLVSQTATAANVIEHSFGGDFKERRVEIRDYALRLPLHERDEKGAPIEWIEVSLVA